MKNWFSLSWFKSNKEEELKKELEEVKEKLELKTKTVNELVEETYELEKKLQQRKVIFTGDQVTVIVGDEVLVKSGVDKAFFEKVKSTLYDEDVIKLMADKQVIDQWEKEEKEIEVQMKKLEGFDHLKKCNLFKVIDSSVYLMGVENRSIPSLLVDEFADLFLKEQDNMENNERFISLKRFWQKCCLNPSAQSAEDLFAFLQKHKMKIGKWGNFFAYRRVVSLEGDKELIDFVSNTYTKIKAVWKKKPSNFDVWFCDDGDKGYVFTHLGNVPDKEYTWQFIGNLDELYKKLPEMKENRYTSAHTGKEDYRVGEIFSIPRNEGSDNNAISCDKGLHICSKRYDYSGFGDTPVLMIVNPMDVLAAPLDDLAKMRTSRFFFACTLSEEERYILDEDSFDVQELDDVFEEKMMENLEEKVMQGFTEEIKRHTFELPTISKKEISTIVRDLTKEKEKIKNRVVTV